jgi:DNA-binding CsgD family transcriptional regulator
MQTFLGVPILVRGQAWGNLYLTEKVGGGPFTAQDEEATVVLARAELVGGELSVARGSSAGTIVRARLPPGRATYSGPTSPWSSAQRTSSPPEPAWPPDDLTEREVEALRLIALGNTNAEIADQLCLSVRTIESHRAHIQQKTRVAMRAGAAGYVLKDAADDELVEAPHWPVRGRCSGRGRRWPGPRPAGRPTVALI